MGLLKQLKTSKWLYLYFDWISYQYANIQFTTIIISIISSKLQKTSLDWAPPCWWYNPLYWQNDISEVIAGRGFPTCQHPPGVFSIACAHLRGLSQVRANGLQWPVYFGTEWFRNLCVIFWQYAFAWTFWNHSVLLQNW